MCCGRSERRAIVKAPSPRSWPGPQPWDPRWKWAPLCECTQHLAWSPLGPLSFTALCSWNSCTNYELFRLKGGWKSTCAFPLNLSLFSPCSVTLPRTLLQFGCSPAWKGGLQNTLQPCKWLLASAEGIAVPWLDAPRHPEQSSQRVRPLQGDHLALSLQVTQAVNWAPSATLLLLLFASQPLWIPLIVVAPAFILEPLEWFNPLLTRN